MSSGRNTWLLFPVIDETLTCPYGPLSTIWNSTRISSPYLKNQIHPNFPWFVISLSSLHPSTFPLVIWHCRRRWAFRTFFVPGERRREARGGGWGGEGVGCRGDKARGSTLLAFNKRHPQHFSYTHPRSPQTPPRSRKGWSWGWRGGVELEEGEIKETHPTIAVRPPSTPFLVFGGFLACPESPFFPRGAAEENTPLHSSASFVCTSVTQFDFGIVWWDLIYCPPHLLHSVASCFGAGGCQDQNGTWIMSHPPCIAG